MEEMHRARYVGRGIDLPIHSPGVPPSQYLHVFTNLYGWFPSQPALIWRFFRSPPIMFLSIQKLTFKGFRSCGQELNEDQLYISYYTSQYHSALVI